MRDKLKQAITNAISVEFLLPSQEKHMDKSCITSKNDWCLNNSDPQKISKIIYNGIVEFAINEYKINYNDLQKEQLKVIKSRIRYDPNASNDTKLKYGFYGEVLLDLILRVFLSSWVLIARGYFYSPIEKGEPKGFDAFHLMEQKGNVELWFGEAKFYLKYKEAITSAMEKLSTSLSDSYINDNMFAIINNRQNLSTHNEQIEILLNSWEEDPYINLADEMRNRNIKLVFPIFIAYQKDNKDLYHNSIKKCIEHIYQEYQRINIVIPHAYNYKLFFIFLPLSEVKKIKETVINWIESQEPLI